jgi:hypothetical protein
MTVTPEALEPLETRTGPQTVSFKKQLARKPLVKSNPQFPHENRFVAHNLSPGVSSNVRRIIGPKFEHKLHRIPTEPKYCAVMSTVTPNKEALMKPLTKDIHFGKMTTRKDIFTSICVGPSAYDVKFEGLDKHVRSPTLGSSQGRHFDRGPCYMNPIPSRLGVEQSNFKSLEMNCYSASGAQSYQNTRRQSKMQTILAEELEDLALLDSFFD